MYNIGATMTFEQFHDKHQYIIHCVLKQYQVKYQYDEYYQQLLIKMWQLFLDYNCSKSSSIKNHLFIRLKYYLIDLFRQQGASLTNLNLEDHTNDLLSYDDSEFTLSLEQFRTILTNQEQQWLELKLAGFTQQEMAHQLNCSTSTLKNYQKRVRQKFINNYFEMKR